MTELSVLIVDDEPNVLKALQRTLSGHGWNVEVAAHPQEAMGLLEEREFAAVISDFRMPGMDGVSLLSWIRDRWPDTERILLTAHADQEALERGINDAGINRLLHKPWRVKVLVSVVERAVAHARLRQEHRVLVEKVRHRNDELSYLNRLLSDRVAQSNQSLLNIRRRWDTALNAISDPVAIVDSDLRVEGVNAATARLSERPADNIEGQFCYEAIFGRTEPCPQCPIGGGTEPFVVEHLGRRRFFDVRVYGLSGEHPAHLCIYRDITEQLAFEKEAAHVEKMAAIGRLASGVAHELNNPLHAILSFSQLAQKPGVTTEKLHRYHEVIRESVIRCRDIIQSLRGFTRREATDQREILDLNAICKKVGMLFAATSNRRVSISLLAPGPARVVGNGNQLQQVLVNLIQNAIDANPEAGVVRCGVERLGEELVVAVEDEGPGVPAADHEKIFEPFFTTKPEGIGTGLGLAISHQIVQGHQGTLRVVDAPSGGARFEARLPEAGGEAAPKGGG